jgi:hypothetical protein
MKVYLVPAVVLLALLTSMGIFGFLSKAHLDQNIGSGDVQAQVSLLDEKINIQRDTVKASKAMLTQMDMQVNDIMTKGDSEKSVERSVVIRKQQAKERASLQKDIEVANKEIQKLNEERAPIASELRKVEAEVGPIKYIAALIYGDNPDANVLERAVRWVIILLVSVFDPLAIMLVLAANQSKEWDENDDVEEENKLREKVTHDKEVETILEEVVEEPVELEVTEEEEEAFKELEPKPEPEKTIAELHPYLNQPFSHFTNTTPIVHKPEVEELAYEQDDEPLTEEQIEQIIESAEGPKILAFGIDDIERPGDYITTIPDIVDITPKKEDNYLAHPSITGTVDSDYVLYNGKRMSMTALKNMHPELFLVADNPREPKIDFGLSFPNDAVKGDTFVRIDSIPNRVFKYNGTQWIETNRELAESYLSNEKYLTFLVEKIATGEYDPELLTDHEQDAIAEHIGKR